MKNSLFTRSAPPGIALLVAGCALSAQAQPVVAPASSTTAEAAQSGSSAARPTASSFASALASDAPLFRRGPISLRPHFEYRVLFGEDIEVAPGDTRDSTIQSVAPGLLVEIGKYWRLDYTPTWTYYSHDDFRDTSDHGVILSGRAPHARGSVGLTESYSSSHAILAQTGRQTHEEKHATMLDGTYRVGRRTFIEGNASRSVRNANAVSAAPEWALSDWVQWSAGSWVHYEFTSRLSAAAGFTAGHADVGVGTDMSFTQPQLKMAWKPGSKISLSAQAGVERRRFDHDARPALTSPVYTAAAGYQILPTTKLALSATRSVSASYFANEVTESRGWTAGLEQRLLQRLYFAADFTTLTTDYVSAQSDSATLRADEYRSMNLRLTTVLLRRATFAVVYQIGENLSGLSAYAFRSTQYGFEASVRF